MDRFLPACHTMPAASALPSALLLALSATQLAHAPQNLAALYDAGSYSRSVSYRVSSRSTARART